MKSQVIHLPQWAFLLLFILLQKSGAVHGICTELVCKSKPSCNFKSCPLPETAGVTITNVTVTKRSKECDDDRSRNFAYHGNQIWTKGCCALKATVCYILAKSSDSHNNTHFVSNSTTAKSTDSYNNTHLVSSTTTGTTPSGWIESAFATTPEWNEADDAADIMNTSTLMMVEGRPEEMQDEHENTNVVLKVALPVGVFVLVILIAVFCFVFRRKVKGLVSQFREPCYKKPDQSNPVYGINGPASGNTASDKFDNLTYAMQTSQEHVQPGNNPAGGYEYAKPMPHKKVGGQTNVNPSKTVESSPMSKYRPEYEEDDLEKPSDMYDTTYQTLSGERCYTSYDHITGSNTQAMTTPQAKFGGTAYDNAAI